MIDRCAKIIVEVKKRVPHVKIGKMPLLMEAKNDSDFI